MPYAPWMQSVSVGNVTAARLSTLIHAIDPNVPVRCSRVGIQYNVGATGVLLVGGSDVAATHCGANLAPGAVPFYIDGLDKALVLTSDIYLLAGAAAQQVNIILFGSGGM